MLEIICAGSLAWSINVCQGRESFDFASHEKVKISNVIQQDITSDRERLAKGKPYESEYRRDADRDREQNEIRQDRDRDRIYRDADCYSREDEYDEYDDYDDGDRDRIYRDADCYRQEGEYDDYDDGDRDRIYRDAEQRRRSQGEYIQPESSIDYRRSGYYRR